MSEKILTMGRGSMLDSFRRVVGYLVDRSKLVDSVDYTELKLFYKGTAGVCRMARQLEKNGVIRRSFKSIRYGKIVTRAGVIYFDDKPKLEAALRELDAEIERRRIAYGPDKARRAARRAVRVEAKDDTAKNLDAMIATFSKPHQRACYGR